MTTRVQTKCQNGVMLFIQDGGARNIMKKFQVFRAVSYVYEVEAEDWAEAELKVIIDNPEPVSKIPTDDIYTEEI